MAFRSIARIFSSDRAVRRGEARGDDRGDDTGEECVVVTNSSDGSSIEAAASGREGEAGRTDGDRVGVVSTGAGIGEVSATLIRALGGTTSIAISSITIGICFDIIRRNKQYRTQQSETESNTINRTVSGKGSEVSGGLVGAGFDGGGLVGAGFDGGGGVVCAGDGGGFVMVGGGPDDGESGELGGSVM